ncbi:MAG: methylmalonyl Co-A mutase-associated GTPase MeaB [Acidimicrobiia bacterium]|nr:methylmalonyl Co-A mutase-associated GTPase MeaB [Acidimicrobiia bacterium]NNF68584.1 methylmalonyl Co-A mutase-associated GTPase MeaB [Acidimicrobiia bacterium]
MSELWKRARTGDIRSLAKAISAVESGDGLDILAAAYPEAGDAHIVGVTGAPGAGKSTLVDRIISVARGEGRRVAVVAVDPSSPFTGGAILGDRVRMQDHIDDPDVYIRSLANRGHLGGISAATPKAVTLVAAAAFDPVIIETVGVGQAEVGITERADTTLVVVNPGWGDSVQAAKAGLLEIGDLFVVNKADRAGVEETVRDLRQMLELGPELAWTPPIITTVATDGSGTDEVWAAITAHREHLETSGQIVGRRAERARAELHDAVEVSLRHSVEERMAVESVLEEVVARRVDPWTAAGRLVGGGG